MWPALLSTLVQNVTNPASTEIMKESSLSAIGYICQDVEPRCLEEQSNDILTAIVHGMKRDEPSNHVKLAATHAMLNSLEFTRSNFEKDSERHYVMQVVCEGTQCEDIQVQLRCIVLFMKLNISLVSEKRSQQNEK